MFHRWFFIVGYEDLRFYFTVYVLNRIKLGAIFEKNIERKRLCRHGNNCYYFCKSNIFVVNFLFLPHPKTIKNTKKLSVFSKNDSRR